MMFYSLALVVTLAQATPASQPVTCSAAFGFVGTVCVPASAGRHPTMLVLGGSGGGDHMVPIARRLAERGYVAATVAYFGLPGLPPALERIPVETVGNALGQVAQRPDVDPQRIGIFGVSKGGELALFAASTYPEIRAVVGLVPSPFAWSIVPRNLNRSMPLTWQPSWTIAGRPVPYVPYEPQMSASSRDAFDISLQRHRGAIPGAMFHLENIRGPVLFVAGDDDQVWNSAEQSEIGMAYLKAHAHAYPDAYVHYPKAGHAFLFATGDRTQVRSGGTADGNAEAEKAAWIAIDDFLDRALVKPPAAS